MSYQVVHNRGAFGHSMMVVFIYYEMKDSTQPQYNQISLLVPLCQE